MQPEQFEQSRRLPVIADVLVDQRVIVPSAAKAYPNRRARPLAAKVDTEHLLDHALRVPSCVPGAPATFSEFVVVFDSANPTAKPRMSIQHCDEGQQTLTA